MNTVDLKTALLQQCQKQADIRYLKIMQSIADIEESLLEEAKSSSGDKHETGRAMLHIERENAGKQLQEIEKIVQILNRIDINAISDYARLGSLVYTDRFNYFISISIGTVTLANADYLCVALHSPVGALLSGKKTGDEFDLNGKAYKIIKIQ